mmetsp:Transcript_46316/g.144899  ORF Transcript_46316/g.144899 Transcript_46316/m.144899 type:complete len:355 (+) Transcript_46316:1223-2287(+)
MRCQPAEARRAPPCTLRVSDAALGGGADELGVLVKRALGVFEGGRRPALAALLEHLVVEEHVDGAASGVDDDGVAVLEEGDVAADLGLRRDVADDEAVGAAGEAAVGDERDVVAEAGAHDGGGGLEHLRHAGAALGALVAQHHHGALGDLLGVDGLDHVVLRVVDLGGAGEAQALLARDLGDGALGGEVAVEDLDVAGVLDGVAERADDLLALGEAREIGEVLGHGLARDGHAGAVDEALLHEELHDGGRAADALHVLHYVGAGGLEVGEEGHAVGHGLEVVRRELDAHGVRHGDEVQHGVGGAARGHDHDHGVLEGGARHDVARLEVHLEQLLDGVAGAAGLVGLERVRGRRA